MVQLAMTRIPLILFSVFYSAVALDIQGKIQWTEACVGPNELGPAKVVLDDARLSGGVMEDGRFVIPGVAPGTYLLSVQSHNHVFDQLRVDVLDSSPEPEVRPYILGTPMDPRSTVLLGYPIVLPVRHRHNYFMPRESFNLIGMFQNPMMVLLFFAGGMMLAMPYIMKNLDPELVQEAQNHQARRVNAGDMKPKPNIEEDSTVNLASGASKNRSSKNKKRG